MSGATIGGVVGAAVGFWIGGPAGAQWGWMIGSAVGGYVDPEQIQGPRLTDARAQTSRDGIVIPFGWGTFPTAGNIIWQQPGVTEHKETERQGKGGPEVTTFTYTRSYAIGICGGPIAGILQIKRNGKIVYDIRDDATLAAEWTGGNAFQYIAWKHAENAKFVNRATIYLGGETQLSDPTIEAYEGAGNVPAYRGMAYIVVTDDDVTDLQGAIPQYEFVVAGSGQSTASEFNVSFIAISPQPGVGSQLQRSFSGTEWDQEPIIEGPIASHLIYGNDILLAYGGTTMFRSTDQGETFVDTGISVGVAGGTRTGSYGGGVFYIPASLLGTYTSTDGLSVDFDATPSNAIAAHAGFAISITFINAYSSLTVDGGNTWTSGGNVPGGIAANNMAIDTNGLSTIAGYKSNATNLSAFAITDDMGLTWDAVTTPFVTGTSVPAIRYGVTTGAGPLWVAGSDDGELAFSGGGSTWTLSAFNLGEPIHAIAYNAGTWVVVGDNGKIATTTDGNSYTLQPSNYDSSDDIEDVVSIGCPGVAIPDAPGFFVTEDGTVCGPSGETLTPEGVLLATIVAELCELEGLTSDEYDVSQLTDIVTGFRIANEGGADTAIAALIPSYFFDVAEWDGKLRFIKRGGTSAFALNSDDLVQRDGDAFERERVQEAELLRRVTVGYIDPAAGYGPSTQKWERRAGTVQARGEAGLELPLTMSSDEGATIAMKRGLVAWGEPEKQRLSLPYRLTKVTPTDIGSYTDDDGNVHTIRLMQRDEEDGVLFIESATNCAEAYSATTSGVAPANPTIIGPNLIGPTQIAMMDLPIWRTTDPDDIGIYVAAAGLLGGWNGTQLDISTDSGASYVAAATITAPATIGYTVTALDGWNSAEEPEDTELTVWLPDAPSSVDYATLLRYNNRAAIQLNGGDWAILQYQDVTALGGNQYHLTGLILGRYNTSSESVASGATFVLLNGAVTFVRAERDYMGEELTVRATSIGTSSDATTPETYDFPSAPASQTEWPPYFLEGERDSSGDLVVTWIGRARLGTDTNPFHSVHFAGYRVNYASGSIEVSYDVPDTVDSLDPSHTYTAAQQANDFGGGPPGPLTITVTALNDITGAISTSESIVV